MRLVVRSLVALAASAALSAHATVRTFAVCGAEPSAPTPNIALNFVPLLSLNPNFEV